MRVTAPGNHEVKTAISLAHFVSALRRASSHNSPVKLLDRGVNNV